MPEDLEKQKTNEAPKDRRRYWWRWAQSHFGVSWYWQVFPADMGSWVFFTFDLFTVTFTSTSTSTTGITELRLVSVPTGFQSRNFRGCISCELWVYGYARLWKRFFWNACNIKLADILYRLKRTCYFHLSFCLNFESTSWRTFWKFYKKKQKNSFNIYANCSLRLYCIIRQRLLSSLLLMRRRGKKNKKNSYPNSRASI